MEADAAQSQSRAPNPPRSRQAAKRTRTADDGIGGGGTTKRGRTAQSQSRAPPNPPRPRQAKRARTTSRESEGGGADGIGGGGGTTKRGRTAQSQSCAPPNPPRPRQAMRARTTSRESEGGGADGRGVGTTKRGKRSPRHLLLPCSSNQIPNWGAQRARTSAYLSHPPTTCTQIQILTSRGCDDDSKSRGDEIGRGATKRGGRSPRHLLRPCSSQLPNWGAQRARTTAELGSSSQNLSLCPKTCAQIQIVTSRVCDDDSKPKKQHMLLPCISIQPSPSNWRDWSNLDDGPAGLIAERVLAYDVADYLRFRAVCRPWRQCCKEPRSHSGLDRQFHPWRWVLLREPLAAPNRRCLLNSSTGECIQLDLPELLDNELLTVTPEGLLVLLHDRNHVHLLNPLTRQLTELPPLATLLPSEDHVLLSQFKIDGLACCSGIASDDSTVVLCFNRFRMLGMAKPGDDHWMLLKYNNDGISRTPLMFGGRFYHVNVNGVMVLQIGPNQQPRLEVAAKLNMHVSPMTQSMHLVNNCGQLMLVHRRIVPVTSRNKSAYRYNLYRVNLDTGKLCLVKKLGGGGTGRAMFLGLDCSFSVSREVFPSRSISANTIYLSFDFAERRQLKVGAYHLADGRIERPSSCPSSLVQRPHTLVDYLSWSITLNP